LLSVQPLLAAVLLLLLPRVNAMSLPPRGGPGGPGGMGGMGGGMGGGLPDALLERMMDRKLRMLDLEYEECVRATRGYDFADYDSGPVGNAEDTDEVPAKSDKEAARAYGYAPFAGEQGEGAAAGSVAPAEAGTNDDEWSEAWAAYKRDCAEEAAEAAAKGLTDANTAQPAADAAPPAPQPLSDATKATIKGVMANVKIKPPPWARNVPDEVWQAQILQRAGLGALAQGGGLAALRASAAPVSASSTAAAAAAPSSDAAAAQQREQERKKRAKKKAKKAAKAAAAAAAASSSTGAAASAPATSNGAAAASSTPAPADDDFETNFPPVDAALASQQQQQSQQPAQADNASEQLHSPD